MPLESVPDLFDDATHNELDRAVEKAIEDDLADVSDLCANWQYVTVINAIIEYSNGTLDKKHTGLEPPKNLIKTHEELRAMLSSAWRRKSYREIRNLGACLTIRTRYYILANELLFDPPAILKAPRQEPKTPTPTSTTSTDTLEG